MGQSAVTSNLFYDLVSIQYHALKGQEVYSKFIQDAKGQQDVVQFFEEVRRQDIQRAEQCHQLLQRIGGATGGTGGTQEPYPTEQTTGKTQGAQGMQTTGTTGGGARQ
jgi:hypothetical protein